MELIFKLPKGKPPFIGILFENIFQASTLNQDFVNELQGSIFTIHMEPIAKMNLRLICENPISIRHYSNLKYDKEKLHAWQKRVSGQVNFGHLMKVYDTDTIVKTMTKQKNFVLKIERVYFEFEY